MGFRKEIRERLGRIEELLERVLEKGKADERLVEQNRELFDRLISRNWEEYWQSPSGMKEMERTEIVMTPQAPLENEDLVGGIFSEEELGLESKAG